MGRSSYWDMLSERCVAVVAAKTPYGFELARKWIKSSKEQIVCTGYTVYSTLFTDEPIRVQNAMNNFVIMAGIYIKPVHEYAVEIAERIGRIDLL